MVFVRIRMSGFVHHQLFLEISSLMNFEKRLSGYERIQIPSSTQRIAIRVESFSVTRFWFVLIGRSFQASLAIRYPIYSLVLIRAYDVFWLVSE